MINKSEEEIMLSWEDQSEQPLVTIRCITYNHVAFLSDALDGFLSQITPFRFEIIVHDDASTDGTSDIVRTYAEKFPHIIVPIIQEENQFSKRNGGMKKAINPKIRGKYVALCEGDDYWTDPYKLKKQIEYMESHPQCSMTFHAVNYEQDGTIIKNDRITSEETDISAEDVISGGGKFVATPSICCKSEDFLNYPEFRCIADIGDYPLQVLLAATGNVHYFPEIMGTYRVMSSGSWSEKQKNVHNHIRHIENQISWLAAYDEYSNKQFSKQVQIQIALCYLKLYKIGHYDFKKTWGFISGLDFDKIKLIYLASVIKNIGKNRKNNRKLMNGSENQL